MNIVTNDDRSKAESDAQTSRLNVLLSDAREIGCENALPRWLSHTLSRSTEIEFPKGHLHSRKQLSAILSDAGFASAEAYLSFPDARWPDLIVPFDDDGMRALKDLDKSQYSKKDQLFLGLPNGLKSGVATSHTFVASKKA